MTASFSTDDGVPIQLRRSSKEKGGSAAHDHSRHKITLKNQQFYLSIFYSSPSTKHATRHNFQLNHSNSCKLHQDDPQHTKMIPQVDSSTLQTLSIYISSRGDLRRSNPPRARPARKFQQIPPHPQISTNSNAPRAHPIRKFQ